MQCLEQWYLHTSICVTYCPLGYEVSQTRCVPSDLTPPEPSLFVNTDNSLLVSFSKPMYMNFTASDLNLEVTDLDMHSYPVTWSQPVVLSNTSFILNLTLTQSQSLPSENQCSVIFLFPQQIRDFTGVSIVKSELTGQLYGNSQSNRTRAVSYTTSTIAKGTIVSIALLSFLNGSPNILWSFLNQLQLISYIPLTTIPVSDKMVAVLTGLNIDSMVPNPFSYLLSEKEHAQKPLSYTERSGITTALFLLNTGLSMIFAGALVTSFVLLYLLSKVGTARFSHSIEDLLGLYHWKIPLRWGLQSYLDIGIFSMLQLQQVAYSYSAFSIISLDSLNIALSSLFCALFLSGFLYIPVLLCKKYHLIRSRKDEEVNQHWGELYLEFDQRRGLRGILFYPYFLFRRLLYACSLIWLYESPRTQALLNTSLSFTVLPT